MTPLSEASERPTPRPEERDTFRTDIEGMRGAAIVGVLLYHLVRAWAPHGYVGVDVFFVISGFVVAASASGRMARDHPSFRQLAGHFFRRRIRRLVPPLTVVALLTIGVVVVAFPPDQIKMDTVRTALFSMAGWSNVHLASRATDYWHDSNLPNAFLHSWSLAVEDQFYLAFPFLFIVLASLTVRRRITLGVVLLSIGIGYSLRQEAADAISAFYLLPSRVWEPALGVMTFFVSKEWASREERSPRAAGRSWHAAIDGMLLASLLAVMFAPAESISSRTAVFLSCGIAAVTIGINSRSREAARGSFLSAKPLRLIGRGSYSCYLVHWPIITLYSILIGFVGFLDYAAAVALVVACSYLLYQLVERHCVGPQQQKIKLGPLVTLQVAALLLALNPQFIAQTTAYQATLWNSDPWSIGNDWQAYATSSLADPRTRRAVGALTQRFDQPSSTFVTETRRPTDGPGNADSIKLFGLGNSYLQSSMPMLVEHALQRGDSFEAWQIMNCSWHLSMDCAAPIAAFLARVKTVGESGGIIYVAMRYPETLESSPWLHRLLPELAAVARQRGMGIVVQGPTPVFEGFSPRACFSPMKLQRADECASAIAVTVNARSRVQRLDEALARVLEPFPNVLVFRPWSSFCNERQCVRGLADGRFFFMDEDHLSVRGSISLLPDFSQAMEPFDVEPVVRR